MGLLCSLHCCYKYFRKVFIELSKFVRAFISIRFTSSVSTNFILFIFNCTFPFGRMRNSNSQSSSIWISGEASGSMSWWTRPMIDQELPLTSEWTWISLIKIAWNSYEIYTKCKYIFWVFIESSVKK